ncbi:hypothetical protein [Undibacterium rugosum]|uniref:hypothetical protein n=1 Tax=Undibacterium rugosum TaxID=2762291 RepID=UPI001B829B4F|nr:hypothetical protein [Undibacterium rugosum]MBR7777946.1 hypothetical protein [Undibacterium rugosum]
MENVSILCDMNTSHLTNLEISSAVKQALKDRSWSVRACSDAFNATYSDEIKRNEIELMDKDLIQRVRNNKFQVVTNRVSNLCDFLEIDLKKTTPSIYSAFIKEFDAIERVVQRNPKLEQKIRALLSNVADVLALNGAK